MDESQQPERRVTLSFTPEAVAMLLEGLGQLPLYRSRELYDAIKQQATEQLAPKQGA